MSVDVAIEHQALEQPQTAASETKIMSEHHQFQELLDVLKNDASCAIVHPDEQFVNEVHVHTIPGGAWRVESKLEEEPASELRNIAAELHLNIELVVDRRKFGPRRGEEFSYYRVFRVTEAMDSASREAIQLFRHLWNLGPDDWLWITAENYDDRAGPQKPAMWPPRR